MAEFNFQGVSNSLEAITMDFKIVSGIRTSTEIN